MPGLLDTRPSIARAWACSSAQARPICSATRSSIAPGSPKASPHAAARTSGIISSARRSTSSPSVRLRRPPRLRRRRLRVEHDCHRPGRRSDSERPRRCGAGRRHRRALQADVQRLQSAAADGSRAVPAVRSQSRRHEHRRRRGHSRARAAGSGARARRADLRRAGRPRRRMRSVSSDGARAGRQAGRGDRHARASGAGINADEVDHVNAHGTATPQNDAAEARGFRRVFGDRAARIPVTSIKSMIGHCLGASRRGRGGGAGADASPAARSRRPFITRETDEECRLDIVANEARGQRVRCAVSTSLGFGGNDSAIVMRAGVASPLRASASGAADRCREVVRPPPALTRTAAVRGMPLALPAAATCVRTLRARRSCPRAAS